MIQVLSQMAHLINATVYALGNPRKHVQYKAEPVTESLLVLYAERCSFRYFTPLSEHSVDSVFMESSLNKKAPHYLSIVRGCHRPVRDA